MAEQTIPVTQTHDGGRLPTTRDETRYQLPPVDIFESADGLTVMADLPGVDKDGIEIRVDDNVLTIEGKVNPVAMGQSLYNEFVMLNYHRQFQLSDEVDQEKIAAEYKHGVLTLKLPKAEKAKPKQIPVQVG